MIHIFTELKNYCSHNLDNSGTLLFAIVISLLIVFVFTLMKFCIKSRNDDKEWLILLIDYPIDYCSSLMSIIVTAYIGKHLGNGLILIFVSFIVISISCYMKRKSVEKIYSNGSNWLVYGYAFSASLIISIYCIIEILFIL